MSNSRHHLEAANPGVVPRTTTTASHEEKRAAEQSLLNALSHAYGVDTQQRSLRMSIHNNTNAKSSDGGAEVTLTERNAMLEQAKRVGKTLVGQEILAQLMLAHMDLTGGPLSAVADTLRSEMKTFGVDESCYISTLSPIPFQLPVGHNLNHLISSSNAPQAPLPSPLATLMCPNTVARGVIQTLLAHTREKILRHCPCIPQDTATLSAIEHACRMPMWSESDDESLLLKRSTASASRRAIVVATHNQLVEALSSVYFNPVAHRPMLSQETQDAFSTAFLRTYRAFMAPHALLAKLLQRYLVPASLTIVESLDAHGIEYLSPPGMHPVHRTAFGGALYSQRTCAWLKVNQLIKVRVLVVLARWLRDFPSHFDYEMAQSILLFLEEQCRTPAAHADCPSMILQAAEFVKVGAVDILSRLRFDTAQDGTVRCSGRVTVPSTGALASVPPTLRRFIDVVDDGRHPGHSEEGHHHGGVSEDLDGMAPIGLVTALASFRASVAVMGVLLGDTNRSSQHESLGGATLPHRQLLIEELGGADKVFARVEEFHALPVDAVARHIRACSHVLMRGFDVDEVIERTLSDAASQRLRAVQHRGGGGTVNGRSLHEGGSTFTVFMGHAERLMYWAATLVVTSALLDHNDIATDAYRRATHRRTSSAVGNHPAADPATTQRVQLLESTVFQLIELATTLIATNDLHSAFGIVAGLNHPAIARLHRPIFARRFLFYDKLEELIAFFDLSTAAYANYVAHLPDDDVDPPILLLHQTCEEIRNLHVCEPSLYTVPTRAQSSVSYQYHADVGLAKDGAIASAWGGARVVVHWRKFQAISGMVEDVAKYQSVPIAHDLFKEAHATFAECARRNREVGRPGGRGGGSGSPTRRVDAASGQSVSVALEASQWVVGALATDARLLAQCSMALWDPAAHDE